MYREGQCLLSSLLGAQRKFAQLGNGGAHQILGFAAMSDGYASFISTTSNNGSIGVIGVIQGS